MKNRISEFRTKLGLTKSEVARRVGTSPQHYGDLESGKKTLNQRWLIKIADVLGVSPGELISENRTSSLECTLHLSTDHDREEVFSRLGNEIINIYHRNKSSLTNEQMFKELAKRLTLLEANLKTMPFDVAFQATLNAIEADVKKPSARAG